jgi:putative tryptophan/tyrosine transport system substrate-binding protein
MRPAALHDARGRDGGLSLRTGVTGYAHIGRCRPVPALNSLQAATRTVPLVGMSEDMVAEGLVTSLARPGGNITGISLLSFETQRQRQDILIEAVPGAGRIAAIADSNATPAYHLQVL